MEYEVKLKQFEGPLDLLLHLIKKENIDIFDISIEAITDQYMHYINTMKEKDLDITSEYLVMAAELIELKSKLLLPNKNEEIEEEIEEEKGNLINRLLEYEKYQNITSTFKELESIRKEVYTRDSEEILNYKNNAEIDYGIDLNDLALAFQKFLQTKEAKKPLNTKIEKKEYSVTKRYSEIRNKIKAKGVLKFEELFDIITKEYVVVTFLAILSMAKKQEIVIHQQNNFNNIIIKSKE